MGAVQFCTNPGIAVGGKGTAGVAFVEAAAGTLKGGGAQIMLTDGMADAYRIGKQRVDGRNTVVPELVRASAGRTAAPYLYRTDAANDLRDHALGEEIFGPLGLGVPVPGADELEALARGFEGRLTATLPLNAGDAALAQRLMPVREARPDGFW